MIREEIKQTLSDLRRFTAVLADSLCVEDKLLDSMIAPRNGDLYNSIQNKIFSQPGVFERTKNWKEIVTANISLAKM